MISLYPLKHTPVNAETGSTCGTCSLLWFHFWEPVFFNTDDASFPNDSPEQRGRFVRISENVGHDTTFKIPNSSTKNNQ